MTETTKRATKKTIKKAIKTAVPIFALALIGVGASLHYPPLGPIIVGFLIWIDLTIEGLRRKQ